MSVVEYIGNQGAGKTLKAVRDGTDLAKKYNCTIHTNIPSFVAAGRNMGLKIRYFESWKELLSVYNTIIVWDEMHVDIDARNFKSRDQMLLTHFFNQLRKRGNHLLFTTQRDRQIDIRIRLQVDKRWEMRHPPGSNSFYFTKFDTQSDIPKVLKRGRFKGRPFFKYYDTYELVKSHIKE